MSRTALLCLVFLGLIHGPALAQQPPQPVVVDPPPDPSAPKLILDAMIIGPVGSSRRAVIAPDALGADIIRSRLIPPKAGDTVRLGDGTTKSWEAATIDEKALLKSPLLEGGYAYVRLNAPEHHVVIAHLHGAAMMYLNGEPHIGDPYGTGWARMPVALRKGDNDLLIKGSRPEVRIMVYPSVVPVFVDPVDPTLPDLVEGQSGQALGAVIVVNATEQWQRDWVVTTAMAGGPELRFAMDPMPPVSSRKFPFEFAIPAGVAGDKARLTVGLAPRPGANNNHTAQFVLSVHKRGQSRTITYRSQIDGSVQYYAALPAAPGGPERAGMIFTLHGAGVEATSQIAAYAAKPWATIIAPTNRRPYGFDWEDTGRLDFLEVYQDAMASFNPDPTRVYLTGHSMGGHGTWQIGAQFPGRFAAIAPSAGWVSFQSYSGAAAYNGGTPIENILRRAGSPSDTLALTDNYLGRGVYVLHGGADDNVPVSEARRMRKVLGEFHPDFAYYERPGAGHWWGNECVDWPPLMDFLRQRMLPDRMMLKRTAFTTASPGVSDSPLGWASVEAQVEPLRPSSVDLSVDAENRAFTGKTTNVARLALELGMFTAGVSPIQIELDGQLLRDVEIAPDHNRLVLSWTDGKWSIGGPSGGAFKSPGRGGLFKDIFRNGVVFVVGTVGSLEENAWAMAKARFDAETFWYRANGSVQIVLDTEFDGRFANRNVLLYGNGESNAAWKALLSSSPITVGRDRLEIGGHEFKGDDVACLFIQPRAGSDVACVGVVGGTGVVGMRLAGRVPYFVSGVGVPDWIVIGPEAMEKGIGGIRGSGFFGNDWRFSAPNSAWRDDPGR